MNRNNNKWSNLRDATVTQNQFNKRLQKNNKTGYVGVTYRPICSEGYKINKPYSAIASIHGINHYLGTYKSAEEASHAYEKFAKENFGEFYREYDDKIPETLKKAIK